MESNGTKRWLTEQAKRTFEIISSYFKKHDKIEMVPGSTIRCQCTVPRGYWTGMPLIYQREPRFVELDQLLILNKIKIKHGTCSFCNTLYFKEDADDNALTVRGQHQEAIGQHQEAVG